MGCAELCDFRPGHQAAGLSFQQVPALLIAALWQAAAGAWAARQQSKASRNNREQRAQMKMKDTEPDAAGAAGVGGAAPTCG